MDQVLRGIGDVRGLLRQSFHWPRCDGWLRGPPRRPAGVRNHTHVETLEVIREEDGLLEGLTRAEHVCVIGDILVFGNDDEAIVLVFEQ
jgi:hypothetical protein